MLISNCQRSLLKRSLLPRVLREHEKLHHIYFLLISLPLVTFNILGQLSTLTCLCCTSFVTVALTPTKQNFPPQTLHSVKIKALFPPLKKCVPSLLQQHSQSSAEVRLKPLRSHCVSPHTAWGAAFTRNIAFTYIQVDHSFTKTTQLSSLDSRLAGLRTDFFALTWYIIVTTTVTINPGWAGSRESLWAHHSELQRDTNPLQSRVYSTLRTKHSNNH